ncbi:hypothetical protein [Acrocarpospora pleiomorpha]|nr:hypothetical protein [Acrocarpospora pleiomorpha]
MMLIVQRIVIRWTKQGRGADEAAKRREVPTAFSLPPPPDAQLTCHNILADQWTGYEPAGVLDGLGLPAQLNGLRFEQAGPDMRVVRAPVWAAYPTNRHHGQVFLLPPGSRARYQANFRFSGSSTEWYYEQWTINIAFAPFSHDLFLDERFDFTKDERVSLYGGPR